MSSPNSINKTYFTTTLVYPLPTPSAGPAIAMTHGHQISRVYVFIIDFGPNRASHVLGIYHRVFRVLYIGKRRIDRSSLTQDFGPLFKTSTFMLINYNYLFFWCLLIDFYSEIASRLLIKIYEKVDFVKSLGL